ncbi:hypothetical protein [Herbiconiux sp.]|uniref:hypothetical protein n=1 Tax=Herbiconiux sp. TaxID=1871186 RepID=UPI0025BB002B|nr:hypothetical protein [Herbiconiux sp.]
MRGSRSRDERFSGRIAGFGTSEGMRVVIGMWHDSPLGAFADVMLEDVAGHRMLLAPRDDVADYIAATYTFDEVRVLPVRSRRIEGGLEVVAGGSGASAPFFHARLRIGAVTALGRLLRSVPRPLATDPRWLAALDPLASRLMPGVHTAGTAGGGRREYYGVTALREIAWAEAAFDGRHLGAFAALDPPVRFGFGSAPRDPQLADVVTTIRSADPPPAR